MPGVNVSNLSALIGSGERSGSGSGSNRSPLTNGGVLGAIAKGVLSHDTMVKQAHLIKVFGDVGFVTGRGQNTGKFQGEPLRADEWITDIYRRVDGRWLCEMTHLTPAMSDEV